LGNLGLDGEHAKFFDATDGIEPEIREILNLKIQ
jgi:hypothetical protein